LVKEAMGFNSNRGDSLNVLNSAFNEGKPEAEIPLWQQPEMIALAKEAARYFFIACIALYLVFGVIRPAFKNIEKARKSAEEEKLRLAEEERLANEQEEEQRIHVTQPYEQILHSVKMLAKEDPKLVASVIKDWVSKDE
jgi:flagellar M-ring protein FliF